MIRKFTLLSVFLMAATAGFAQDDQRNCGSMEVLERQLQADPAMRHRLDLLEEHTAHYVASQANSRSTAGVITIPVVVHVVYNKAAENVSATMIQNQINVLTADFRKLNADAGLVPANFAGVAADTEIEFCLATVDPSGNPTSGITRTYTSKRSFSSNDWIKQTSRGGKDAWPADKYLNLWVGNLSNGLLGYAQFPGGPAATDGVVVLYSSLPGGSAASYNKGRTATHEVGHWLNLRHIWGDATCGNDFVSDTPLHNTSNGGCPTSTHRSTCSGTPLEMWMNYMDYTYDACMYMFSAGQKSRMQAVLAPGGARYSLVTSPGCGGAAIAQQQVTEDASRSNETTETLVFPNPVTSEMNIAYTITDESAPVSIEIYNSLGRLVKRLDAGTQQAGRHTYSLNADRDLAEMANGMYLCSVRTGDTQRIVRFMLAR